MDSIDSYSNLARNLAKHPPLPPPPDLYETSYICDFSQLPETLEALEVLEIEIIVFSEFHYMPNIVFHIGAGVQPWTELSLR